jgi:hypothetical protein
VSVVSVTPGLTYQVVAGAGGGGAFTNGCGAYGCPGGDSQLLDPNNNVLLFAGGGIVGAYPPGGAGGAIDPGAMISHPGFPYLTLVPLTPYLGHSWAQNLAPNGIAGQEGACNTGGNTAGYEGFDGYVSIKW